MSESETIHSLSQQLKALEAQLSSVQGSATNEARRMVKDCADEVTRLQRQLEQFGVQQSRMEMALQELIPGFDRKLEEVHNREQRNTQERAAQIVQSLSSQCGKK